MTSTEPRARNAEATRADLLHAAMRRFTVLGYDRTTTRDIAADAGANVSLISRYFGSKEGLFAEVLRMSADAVETPSASDRDDRGDLVTGLVASLDGTAWPDFGGEHPLLLLVRDSGEGEQIRRLRRRALRGAVAYVRDQLRERHGPESLEQDADLQAETVLALTIGLATMRSALPRGALRTADDETLRALVRRLVAAVPPTGDGEDDPTVPGTGTVQE